MEVICSLDLWIRSFQFGLPGAMNDLNILEVSNHFQRMLAGEIPVETPSYILQGKLFNWFYYLTDSIYSQWKIFVKTVQIPSNLKMAFFSKAQEGVRKCVERFFGVLFKRFNFFLLLVNYGQ